MYKMPIYRVGRFARTRRLIQTFFYMHGLMPIFALNKKRINTFLYDVAFIQWVTSCHKSRRTTREITLWRVHVTPLTTSISTRRFIIEIVFTLSGIKPHLKGHLINKILHSWSFHMKFMKLAEGSFHKFHMK